MPECHQLRSGLQFMRSTCIWALSLLAWSASHAAVFRGTVTEREGSWSEGIFRWALSPFSFGTVLAGMFNGAQTNFGSADGPGLLIFAFEAVIIGGLGSLWGTLAGGIAHDFNNILASIFGLFMWRFRKHMRGIVWGTIICMIGLHFVMKAPVWALIGRVGVFSSSSYYHRFLLIDNFIKRFNEWWFIGVKDTAHWNEYIQTWDVSNNYVRVGVDGGLLAFVLFITIIVLSFRNIGKMVRLAEDSMNHQKLFWSLGVAMFSYVVSFLGVSLWDQTIIVWYFIIAVIASLQYESSTAANPLEETAPTALQNGLTV